MCRCTVVAEFAGLLKFIDCAMIAGKMAQDLARIVYLVHALFRSGKGCPTGILNHLLT
jgi:hypothetical protein